MGLIAVRPSSLSSQDRTMTQRQEREQGGRMRQGVADPLDGRQEAGQQGGSIRATPGLFLRHIFLHAVE